MLSTLPVSVAFFAAAVSAQISGQTTSANSTIDPNSIELTIRNQWCAAQTNTCGTLCSGAARPNTCDGNTLTYNCTCTANSSTPALALYTQTMPTFICEQIFQTCIKDNENVAAAQARCTEAEATNCGHLDPENFTAPAVTTTTSSVSASGTGTVTPASVTGSASSSSSTGAAATMVAIGGQYGSGLMFAGAAAAFGMIL